MQRQVSQFLVALQFLTRLPVPQFGAFDASGLARSARYFPLVGALVGWLCVGVWWLSSLCFPPAVAVGLTLIASLLVTGALHEDGFADVCDGFGGGLTRDSVLAIMKDSRIGAYGGVGLVMLLGMKWSTLAALPRPAWPLLVVASQMVSRWCATALIWRMRYVRTDADAKSRPLAGSLSGADWLWSGVWGALALAPLWALLNLPQDFSWWPVFVAALMMAFAVATVAGMHFKQRIGGYTGDCLGAVQQLAELAFLLTGLAVMGAR